MSEPWDPLGDVKGCLNFLSGCLLYAIVSGTLLGPAILFLSGAENGRWEDDRVCAALCILAVLLIPWMIHGVARQKAWYRILGELLAVGAAMLIFSAMLFPAIDRPSNRGLARRTMADMKTIAEPLDAFYKQNGVYPAFHDTAACSLFFHRRLPAKDAWRNPFKLESSGKDYWIVSMGRDGKAEVSDAALYKEERTASYSADIVIHNGLFIRYPEGLELDRSR